MSYSYMKFMVDDIRQQMVFFELISPATNNKLEIRAIPLNKLLEVETRLAEYLEGDTVGIYFEQAADRLVEEKHYIDRIEPVEADTIEYVIELTKRACEDKEFDELLKPPSIDEQVEDFIKEFFTDEDSEEIEQKDFLEEFFSELEEEAEAAPLVVSKDMKNRDLAEEIQEEFEDTKAESRDFLAEFFAEIEEEDDK
jgi:hypothetical protein